MKTLLTQAGRTAYTILIAIVTLACFGVTLAATYRLYYAVGAADALAVVAYMLAALAGIMAAGACCWASENISANNY